MTKYIKCGGGGLPPQVLSDMEAVLNKKFGTSTTYPSNTWPDLIRTMIPLPEESASGTIATFNDGADTVPLKSLTLTATPSQSGTGDPSPSNPRPLNSFSSLTVKHTGKNMFTSENEQTPAYINSSGTIQSSNGWALSDYIEVKEGVTYYFQPNSQSGSAARHAYFDSSKTFVSAIHSGAGSFTVPSGIKYIRFSYRTSSTDIQLEFGSSATTYEEYRTPDPHTLDLGSTVYGLTGDCVTGEFEETHGVVDLGSLSWTYSGGVFRATLTDGKIITTANVIDYYCERYLVKGSGNSTKWASDNNVCWHGTGSSCYVYITDSSYTDPDDFKTAVTGSKLCYELATPTALTIDPVEVESFKGGNNIWCDKDNSSAAVEYRADIDLYINQ